MVAALLLLAAAIQLGFRLAGRPSLASRVLPTPLTGPPFLVWAGRLWLSFALPAFLALLLLGRMDGLWRVPPELDGAVRLARTWGRLTPGPILTGLLIGSALGAVLAWWRARRGKRPVYLGRPPTLPTTGRELPGAVLLALSAGAAEELYFRLVLPLLVATVTGSALLGVAVGTLSFGALHRYQGWVGVAATIVAGVFLSFLHLGSGQLWLAVAAHAMIDLNALVVRPALAFGSPGAR